MSSPADDVVITDLNMQLAELEALLADLKIQRDEYFEEAQGLARERDELLDTLTKARAAQQVTPPANVYESVETWVVGWLRPRSADFPRWCEQWWDHPEALTRIRGLWLAWESHTRDGSLSKFLMYDFDHHITKLTAASGPFGECGKDQHSTTAPRITDALPPELPTETDWLAEAMHGQVSLVGRIRGGSQRLDRE